MTYGGIVAIMHVMPRRADTNVLFIRTEKCPDLRRRFKSRAAAMGMAYHEYLTFLLEKDESRERRQRAQMAGPLHRPGGPPVTEGEFV